MAEIPSQSEFWERAHARGAMRGSGREASALARRVGALVRPHGALLELGCGRGWDAAYLAGRGLTVVGSDVSPTAVRENGERFAGVPDLSWRVVDMAGPLPFPDRSFDAVYARLSLHYFTDVSTRAVVRECARVLTAGGLLCFLCKSTDDPLCGQGEEIAPQMFLDKGRVRHFFDAEYARALVAEEFTIHALESRREDLYGRPSATVLCLARRRSSSDSETT